MIQYKNENLWTEVWNDVDELIRHHLIERGLIGEGGCIWNDPTNSCSFQQDLRVICPAFRSYVAPQPLELPSDSLQQTLPGSENIHLFQVIFKLKKEHNLHSEKRLGTELNGSWMLQQAHIRH